MREKDPPCPSSRTLQIVDSLDLDYMVVGMAGTKVPKSLSFRLRLAKSQIYSALRDAEVSRASSAGTPRSGSVGSTICGRKIENTVPVFPGAARLRTRMLPPCFRTIPKESHNPRPVPPSFFVV